MSQSSKTVLYRGIAGGIAVALLWSMWYFLTGNVPELTGVLFLSIDFVNLILFKIMLVLKEPFIIELPFAISRWWDVCLPLFLAAGIVLLRMNSASRNKLVWSLIPGLLLGVYAGVMSFEGNLLTWDDGEADGAANGFLALTEIFCILTEGFQKKVNIFERP